VKRSREFAVRHPQSTIHNPPPQKDQITKEERKKERKKKKKRAQTKVKRQKRGH